MEQATQPAILCDLPQVLKAESLSCNIKMRDSYCKLSYAFSAPLSRTSSPTLFIPEFLEEQGFFVRKGEKGQLYNHTATSSSLFAVGPHSSSIQVLLDIGLYSSSVHAKYQGQNFSQAPVLNDLVLEMMKTYLQK